MITEEQIANLKGGEKLIFVEWGGTLSTDIGNVYTFANWFEHKTLPKRYFQCQELLDMGNTVHNMAIHRTELFNPEIHKEYRIMDAEKINQDLAEFTKQFGD
jgi:hypothetical protein